MPNRLNLHLDEWKAELKAEPAALASAAAPEVQSAAAGAAGELRATYPTGPTGNLRAGVVVVRDRDVPDPAKAAEVVLNLAPHAHLYEDGTRYARARPTFYPITNRHMRDMVSRVSAMLAARGYQITGSVD